MTVMVALGFAALALAVLAAGIVAVGSNRGAGGLAGLGLGLAAVMLLYEASGLAIVALASIVGAALVVRVAGGAPVAGTAVGTARRVAIAGVLAGLAFVLVGTWARQYMWAGRELVPGAGFGALPSLAGALAGTPGLLGIGLVIVVATAACAGPPRHRI